MIYIIIVVLVIVSAVVYFATRKKSFRVYWNKPTTLRAGYFSQPSNFRLDRNHTIKLISLENGKNQSKLTFGVTYPSGKPTRVVLTWDKEKKVSTKMKVDGWSFSFHPRPGTSMAVHFELVARL